MPIQISLAGVLAQGNQTGGTDIVVLPADAITSTGALSLGSAGATDVTITAQTRAYNFSASGDVLATTAQDIVGAINEVAGAGGSDLATTLGVGNTTGANNIVVTSGQSVVGAVELTLASATTAVASLDSGTTGAVNVGTGANSKTTTIGNVTGASSVVVNSGTGGVDINATGAGGITVDAGATGGFSVDGSAASNVSTTAAALSITTITSGALDVTSAGTVSLDGTTVNVGSAAASTAVNVATDATAKTITIGNATGATGITLRAGASGAVQFDAGGSARWNVSSSGHLLANTDNAIDIGATGATRPRSIYVGTSMVVEAGAASFYAPITAVDGEAVSIGNAATATEGCLLYTDKTFYAFATGTNQGERSGMGLDATEVQLEFFYNNARIAFMNGNGTDFQTRRIDNFRVDTTNFTTDTTVADQDTGGVLTNIGAAGLVTLTLPSGPSEGHNYTIYRVDNFALRVQPFAAEGSAIILAAGKQADDNYVELGAVGSSIKLVCNTQGDWMAVYENGTITPE